MIYVPLETLTEALIWQNEVYVPTQDGAGVLPGDLAAHLAAGEAGAPATTKPRIIPIRPDLIIDAVLWEGTIYAPTPGVATEPPRELVQWLEVMQPDNLYTDQLLEDAAPDGVTPDGSRRESASPDLVAQELTLTPEQALSGLVTDGGHAAFGATPEVIEEINELEVGTPILVG